MLGFKFIKSFFEKRREEKAKKDLSKHFEVIRMNGPLEYEYQQSRIPIDVDIYSDKFPIDLYLYRPAFQEFLKKAIKDLTNAPIPSSGRGRYE